MDTYMNAYLNLEEIYVLKITLEKQLFFKKELASKLHKLSHLGFIKRKTPIYPIPTRKERKKGQNMLSLNRAITELISVQHGSLGTQPMVTP